MKRWYSGRSSSIGSKSRYAITTKRSSKDTRSRQHKLKNATYKVFWIEFKVDRRRLIGEETVKIGHILSNGNYIT